MRKRIHNNQDMECINAVMPDHFGCFWLASHPALLSSLCVFECRHCCLLEHSKLAGMLANYGYSELTLHVCLLSFLVLLVCATAVQSGGFALNLSCEK